MAGGVRTFKLLRCKLTLIMTTSQRVKFFLNALVKKAVWGIETDICPGMPRVPGFSWDSCWMGVSIGKNHVIGMVQDYILIGAGANQ